jgi:subtilisin family serine protease
MWLVAVLSERGSEGVTVVRRFVAFVGFVSLAALSLTAASPARAAGRAPGRYVVVLQDSVKDPDAVAAEHARRYNAQVTFLYRYAFEGYAAAIPNDRVDEVRGDPRVAFVSEDRPVEVLAQSLPTGVDRIDGEASSHFSGISTPRVAVIDTGSGPHSDLNIVGGKNCSTGRSYSDGNGHGTHVAGTIGARNNTDGVVGVAPGVSIYSVRVLNNAGSGTWSSVACGIDWVTQQAKAGVSIKVASMSLGGGGTDDGNCGNTNNDALHKAICGSVAAGVTYVVAAGNSAADFAGFVPAAYDEVLTVTAMSDSDGRAGAAGGAPNCRTSEGDDVPATFSNYAVSSADKAHTIAGPGACILSTWKGGGYNTISGTSMATPHVSGTAVLCIAKGACGSSPAAVKSTLQADAAAQPSAYGFAGSPSAGTKFYGYLVYAGGY